MTITSNKTLQIDETRINELTPFLQRALPLARLGLRVFPCDVRGKEPVKLESGKRLSPLRHAVRFEEAIKAEWEGVEYGECNVGCFFPSAAQNNFVVDIDSISACEKILCRSLSFSGVAEVKSSTADKRHAYFSGKVPEWFWAFNADYTDASGNKHELFSVRNRNRYTVGPGSIHPSGVTYSWLNGEPAELPPINETLLRELQEIAERKGCKRPDPKAEGEPMPAEKYEAWVENLRENFERLELSLCEERISRRHGGIEFVFHPCPLGDHDSGNNTGLITVAPSGKIGWHCFHSSHSMPWREARKIIEDQAGSSFTFPSGPEATIGNGKTVSESVEEAHVEYGFDKCFTGSGATRDGFLSRCCIVSDYGNEAPPDWKVVNRARVRELVDALKGCLTRTDLPEEDAAKEARHQYVRFLQRQEPLYASRLQFLFTQDLYARALFSSDGRITVEIVRRAIAWTQHQLLTRQALWPLDACSDKFERMYLALRAAYSKHKTLSVSDARKFANVSRPGSGGITVFNMVHANMVRSGELEPAGMNRKNKPRFKWTGD